MQKAAPRRAVMASAEGEPRLALDRHVVRLDARTIVGSMNEKAPGPNRPEAGERIGDPVALLRLTEGPGARSRFVRCGRDQRPDRPFIRLPAEIGLHEPSPAAPGQKVGGLERARWGLGRREALEEEVGPR